MIIDRGLYEDLERAPGRQVSVEVACALEGLNDAYESCLGQWLAVVSRDLC